MNDVRTLNKGTAFSAGERTSLNQSTTFTINERNSNIQRTLHNKSRVNLQSMNELRTINESL